MWANKKLSYYFINSIGELCYREIKGVVIITGMCMAGEKIAGYTYTKH